MLEFIAGAWIALNGAVIKRYGISDASPRVASIHLNSWTEYRTLHTAIERLDAAISRAHPADK